MGIAAILGQGTEWRAVRLGGQDGAGGKVDADADDIIGRDAAGSQNPRDGALDRRHVIVRVLQGGIRLQGAIRAGNVLIDDAVGIGMHGLGNLAAVGQVHQHGSGDSVPKSMPIAYLLVLTSQSSCGV
jgi:hypothetical protein